VGGKPFKESESHSVMSRRSHRLSLSTRYARHRHLLRLQPPRFNELHRPSPPSHIGGSIVVEAQRYRGDLKETRHPLIRQAAFLGQRLLGLRAAARDAV
jgi:hypothetical protein